MKSSKIKRPVSPRNLIANTLIVVGVLLFVVGFGYQAINYPWWLLLQPAETAVTQELPDPKPLPESALNTQLPSSASQQDMPGAAPFLASRPSMNLIRLGAIKIPKIRISENLVEGSGHEMLYGVGHVPGTALPGQPGNCALGGHRNYIAMHPFRHLDKVELGDHIYLEDENNRYDYEVFKSFIVKPEESWVMAAQEEEEAMLTLITCTPVIEMTDRLIVWARLVDTQPLSPGNGE